MRRTLSILAVFIVLAAFSVNAAWIDTKLPGAPNVLTIAVAANNFIYAGCGTKGVFRSTDQGASWVKLTAGLPADGNIYALCVKENIVFLGTYEKGVYYSTNSGDLWNACPIDNFTGRKLVSMVSVPDGKLYVGFWLDGTSVSADNGQTWAMINNPQLPATPEIKTLDRDAFGNIYVSIPEKGIFFTGSGGAAWLDITSGLDTATTINTITGSSDAVIYIGDAQGGIYSYTGTGWALLNAGQGWSSQTAYIKALYPVSGGVIYAGTWGNGVYVTYNNGVSWSALNNGLSLVDKRVFCFALDSLGYLYAGMGNGVYRSSSVSVLPSPQLTIITPGTNKGLLSFPNPVSGATQIQWRPLADPRNSTLNIYDINGKTVRSISVSLNEGSALWDGTSAAGASVVSGLYIFKLKAQDRMLQGQCIINR